MGLDMYLYATAFQSSFTLTGPDKKITFEGPFKRFESVYKDTYMSKETRFLVGYWRKFNALHGYIVKKYAEDGADNCRPITLERENIIEIIDTLKSITLENAMEVMPPTSGFFFGSDEIDECYMKNVEYSIEIFEEVLKFLEEECKFVDGKYQNNKNNPYPDYKYRQIIYEVSW